MSSVNEVNVLCIWHPNDRLKEYLEEGLSKYPQVKLIIPPDLELETLLELAPEADIIMGWRPKKEFLEKATKAKLFLNPGAGVQHLIPIFKEVTADR